MQSAACDLRPAARATFLAAGGWLLAAIHSALMILLSTFCDLQSAACDLRPAARAAFLAADGS